MPRFAGISAVCYHAGMTTQDRADAQIQFMQNKVTTICATAAFGLGIDKPDIRLVVHWKAPKGFDQYIQVLFQLFVQRSEIGSPARGKMAMSSLALGFGMLSGARTGGSGQQAS